jgi:ATP-dependent Clp protease ATP-binding subunit ClpB
MNLNQFTVKAQESVVDAQALALKKNHQSVDPEHLLFALLKQKEGLVAELVEKKTSGTLKNLVSAVDKLLEKKPQVHGNVNPYLSNTTNKILIGSEEESKLLKDDFVSTEHIFLALLNSKDPNLVDLFTKFGFTKNSTLSLLKEVRGSQKVSDQNPEEKYNALEKYTRDLTKAASNGRLDPVIGRDSEIRRVIQVLSRRTKNNPVLIGDPGVGKTAMSEREKNLAKESSND